MKYLLARKVYPLLALMIPIFILASLVFPEMRLRAARIETRVESIGIKAASYVAGPSILIPESPSVSSRLAPIDGPLQVDKENPRYFTNRTGRAILLVGDHTWYTLQDSGPSLPPQNLDYTAYLNFLVGNHINFFRFFVWEQSRCSELVGCSWYFAPSQYARTGPGIAYDGLPKFDVTQFNQPYFDRLRERVIAAGQKGIYVSIQLFDGFSVVNKNYGSSPSSPWPGHPFNKDNNINGVNGDTNGNGQGEETETLSNSQITNLQEAYVKKVIDTVNDLDNILFEICNESNAGPDYTAWQNHMIDLIHTYEASKPKQHPVGFTAEFPGGDNKDIFASHADWVSPNNDGDFYSSPPPADGSKVVIADTDHLCGICGDRVWMWKSVTMGYNPIFMDSYDCQGDPSLSNCIPDDPTWVSLRRNLGYALNYAERINLVAMTPHPELASSGYALANPSSSGAEYLIYLPTGGTVTVNLASTTGLLNVEWFNPLNGKTVEGGAIAGNGIRSLKSPFNDDTVLYISQSTPDKCR